MVWNGNAEAQRQADRAYKKMKASARKNASKSRASKKRKFVRPNYSAYIRSAKWQQVKKRLFDARGEVCEQCGSASELHVHHLNYVRLGRERLEDLQILCKQCHSTEHEDIGVFSALAQEYFRITGE